MNHPDTHDALTGFLKSGDPAALRDLLRQNDGSLSFSDAELHAASLAAARGEPGAATVVDVIPAGFIDFNGIRYRGWDTDLITDMLWQVAVTTGVPRNPWDWHYAPADVEAAEARPEVQRRLAQLAEKERRAAERQRERELDQERKWAAFRAQGERDKVLAKAHGYPKSGLGLIPADLAKVLAQARIHGAVAIGGGRVAVPREPAGALPEVGATITVWSPRNGALPKIVKSVTPLCAESDLLWDQVTVKDVPSTDGRPSEALVLNRLTTALMKRAAKFGAVPLKIGKTEMTIAAQKPGARTVTIDMPIGIGMPGGYPHYGKPKFGKVTGIVRLLGEKAGVEWVEVEVALTEAP